MESLTGMVIDGKYRVGRSLGEGGMGAVYLAEHIGIGRNVALKIVRPELLSEPTAAERFQREARAAGAIQHPNVVNVTDFGIAAVAGSDIAYLVMEQLHGQTLEDVLHERRRIPLRQVVDIVEQVASALTAAHVIGVVHRDLKPANIWLSPDDRGGFRVTLLDFGIAKLRDDGLVARQSVPVVPEISLSNSREADNTSTQVGESIGTPAYMSPEQCVGDAVDARSDIYSLGIVVYQLLVGELPFRGSTVELLRAHFVAEVPAFTADSGIGAGVDQVVRRALSKEPDQRFQSALAFASALRAHSMGFSESMRRALVIFAERLPELARLGACFALPGVAATIIGALLWKVPLIWMMLISFSVIVSGPMAMASIAATFEDVKHRPFAAITWRGAAIAVVGHDAPAVRLVAAWVTASMSRYLSNARRTKGQSIRAMLTFIDLFRHAGVRVGEERLGRMADVLPKGALATMVVAQLVGFFVAPTLAMLAQYGLLRLFGVRNIFLVALTGSVAFTAMLFLQTFIALVDVMLYDLAYDMTAE